MTFLVNGPLQAKPVHDHGSPDAKSPQSDESGDHAAFEAVTGDTADEDKNIWDSFYKNKNNVYGKEPVSFLRDHLKEIPKGLAFVPAMGEGRNAIFLAKNGFTVEGNDISEVAIDKTLAEAKLQKVKIKTTLGDLNQYHFRENTFDLIVVSLYYEKHLIPQFKRALKKGGYILFYNKIEIKGLKQNTPDDFAVDPKELKEAVKDFQIKPGNYQEYNDHGMQVVGLLARKP